jgi:uncharacterized protein YbcI
MSEREPREQRTRSEVEKAISDGLVRLHSQYYGHGPVKACTYYVDDLVLVRLNETFTRAERTLIDRGEKDAIQHIRRRFQQHMAEEFKAVVEQATGRSVLSFLSETNVETDISIECFFVGTELTDMTSYEP